LDIKGLSAYILAAQQQNRTSAPMFRAILRVLFGFAIACLTAGLMLVLFVITPADLATESDRAQGAAVLALMAATQAAVFSAPFVFLATALGEWQAIRNWVYYALAGIAVAMTGFLVQYSGEPGGQTIMNDYAFKAFLTTGFAAGFVYWAIAGRNAGGAPADPETATLEVS
jgi:hypothetical protein